MFGEETHLQNNQQAVMYKQAPGLLLNVPTQQFTGAKNLMINKTPGDKICPIF